jgi:pre-mRNA-splicing factor ATP-dependent RNA helicase DHX38/PRP16
MHLDAREWEEEQVRLDRDWYSTYDEGAVVSRPSGGPASASLQTADLFLFGN